MAHQQQRAGILLQRLLEQLERFDVEVVGRLVEHDHVGGFREQPREQQAVALAAGEHAHGRLCALRGKQEVREVTHDVTAPIALADPVRVRAHRRRDGCVRVQLRAQLVEIGDAQLCAEAHLPRVRDEFAEHELEQRGLARAVRTDQA